MARQHFSLVWALMSFQIQPKIFGDCGSCVLNFFLILLSNTTDDEGAAGHVV